MNRLKKFFFKALKVFLAFIILFSITVTVVVSCAPQFGEKPSGYHLEQIKQSPHYGEDGFENLEKTVLSTGDKNWWEMTAMWFTAKNSTPIDSIPVNYGKNEHLDTAAYITWYGHSAVLLEIDNKRILLDPMLGVSASPVSWMTKRFKNQKPPFDLDSINDIDFVIISHDHYDHLDYESISKLKSKTKNFILPLGVGAHLKRWEVDTNKITELDWYDSVSFDGITISALPARHFSGRSLTDRDKTLWASWAVKGKHQNIFFSGDGGYGEHFKKIGDLKGPFDLAMMECGQYNEAWAQIHCLPEQSVQGSIDVNAKQMMTIHWGAFDLSVHSWKEPIERAVKASDSLNVNLVTPFVGERFKVGSELHNYWWKDLK